MKIKPVIDQYNWKEILFQSIKKDWKKFSTLYIQYNSQEIRHTYNSKHNTKHKNQVILLTITGNEKWHYVAVKKLSALFCKVTSKNEGNFSFLKCLHSSKTENKLKEH